MKKKMFLLTIGILLISLNAFAADGDFIVEGKTGIGITTPMAKLDVIQGSPTVWLGTSNYASIFATEFPSGFTVATGATVERSNTVTESSALFTGFFSAVHTGSADLTSTSPGGLVGISSGIRMAGTGGPTITLAIGMKTGLKNKTPGNKLINYKGLFLPDVQTDNGTYEVTDYRHIDIDNVNWMGSVANSILAGIWIDQQTGGVNDYGIVLDGDGTGADVVFGQEQDASIYWDGTNLIFDTSQGTGYFSGEVSATAFNTRTTVWDKKKGKALNFLKDADQLTDAKRKIKHNNFPEKITYQVTDFSNCWDVVEKVEYCWKENERENCVKNASEAPENVSLSAKEYKRKACAKKTETGVSMNLQIAKHEQALYESYEIIKDLQSELCSKDSSYSWCQSVGAGKKGMPLK